MNDRVWDPKWVAILRQKRRQGLSAGTIAIQMNEELHTDFTRNSIIGKLNREGIPAPSKLATVQNRTIGQHTVRSGRKRKQTMPTPTLPPTTMPTTSTPPEPPATSPPSTTPMPTPPYLLVDLPDEACHWPVNEPATWRDPHLFCGAPATRQTPPYCEEHYAMSVVNYRVREPWCPVD
jgi:hypothetical protein